MTRRDEDGDLAGLTPADGLGFVNGEEIMDTPKTVEVPVDYLRHLEKDLREEGLMGMADQAKALIPKPKPRLVAVNPDSVRLHLGDRDFMAQLEGLPNLLDTFDSVIDTDPSGIGLATRDRLKRTLREKFGVDHD